jgi:hypothetical protein
MSAHEEAAPTEPKPLFSEQSRYRLQAFAVVCGPLFTLCTAVGWLGFGQGLAPFDPSLSAKDLGAAYAADDLQIILGCTLFLIGCGLLVFWVAQLSVMMATLEGRRPLLAIVQLIGGIGVVTFVSSACCLWIGAAYRAGGNPAVTEALNDAGWFTFMLTWPGLSIQMVAAGLVVWAARGREDALAPGWVGQYCFFSAAVIALVGFVAFTKTGPFAWNGVLGYYVPFAVWGLSFELLSWSMLRTLKRDRDRGRRQAVAPVPQPVPVAAA